MSNKWTTAAIILSALLIAVLVGLGIRLWFGWQETLSESDDISANSSDTVLEELSSANEPVKETEKPVPETETETEESPLTLIWVGDSRTLGMRDALEEPTDDIFIGAAGEGYSWLSKKGIPELEKTIKSNPDCPVVMNMGVNDYENIDNYLTLYADLTEEYPDTLFYFLSVYPVDDEAELQVTNKDLEEFNARIEKVYPDTYIDCCSYLNDKKIETFDGVHYAPEDYVVIYEYVRENLENQLR